MPHDHASVNGAHGSHDDVALTCGPCTFIVDGRTYTGTYGGQFFDDAGNELPFEVGLALFDRSTEEERVSRASSAPRAGEQVFRVDGAAATRAPRTRMNDSALLERHLQSWVKQHPSILGEDVLIVTEEFDQWRTASGDARAERLDVLALDRSGRLVVAELKRHRAPDAVLVQALNYAAMASRFTLDLLAQAHARFLSKPVDGTPVDAVTDDDALERLREWAPDVSDETLAPCRTVLVAEDYSPVLTNTCIFLLEAGLDLRVMRVGLHDVPAGAPVLTAAQVLPVPQASDFMVSPGPPGGRRTSSPSAGRRNPQTERLAAAGVIADDTELTITVPAVGEDRETVDTWLDADPRRRRARWRNDPLQPIRWALDDSTWAMRDLARKIIVDATHEQPRTGVWGPNWFVAPDGRTIARIDKDYRREHGDQA